VLADHDDTCGTDIRYGRCSMWLDRFCVHCHLLAIERDV